MFGKRITAVFLTICLLFTLLPQIARAEEGGGAIRLVSEEDPTGGIRSGDRIWFGRADSGIYFDGCFRVLDADHTNVGSAGMFLLSEKRLEGIRFEQDESLTSAMWRDSDAKAWCDSFYETHFSAAEQSSIPAVSKTDHQFTSTSGIGGCNFRYYENILNNDKVFFLSAEEANSPAYGFSSDQDRIAISGWNGEPAAWWLRSCQLENAKNAGNVPSNGWITQVMTSDYGGARPALNLDMSRVLFVSAYNGGKSTGTPGPEQFKEVPAYTGTDWKLTIQDPAHLNSGFSARLLSRSADTAEIVWSNAVYGEGEVISAMIVNSDGEITYYGQVASAGSFAEISGIVTLDLAGKFHNGDAFYILNEHINDGKDEKTDYTGLLQNIPWHESASVADARVSAISAQTYTGREITPVPVLQYQGDSLTLGKDFTVSYKNNTKAGTASVTITGIGAYGGKRTETFTIKPAAIGKAAISGLSAKTYTGSAFKPAPTVKFGGKTLKAGTDYTVAYKNNTNAGTATVTLRGKGNFTGTASRTFTIKPASVAGAKLSGLKEQTYTGKALTPAPTVKLGTKTLKSGTDYTVSYKNNTNAGTATVTVTGKGNYTGRVTGSFTITKPADPVKEFVARLYRVCLDREPEAAGHAWWVGRLKAKQETGGSCAWGFFDSTEFKNHKYGNAAFLDHAYLAFFDRRPDAGGKNYWLGEMKKGMTRKQVISGFAASNEWAALCRAYNIRP